MTGCLLLTRTAQRDIGEVPTGQPLPPYIAARRVVASAIYLDIPYPIRIGGYLPHTVVQVRYSGSPNFVRGPLQEMVRCPLALV